MITKIDLSVESLRAAVVDGDPWHPEGGRRTSLVVLPDTTNNLITLYI